MAYFRFWLAHDSYMDNALNFDCKEIVERSAVQKLTSVITKSFTLFDSVTGYQQENFLRGSLA